MEVRDLYARIRAGQANSAHNFGPDHSRGWRGTSCGTRWIISDHQTGMCTEGEGLLAGLPELLSNASGAAHIGTRPPNAYICHN